MAGSSPTLPAPDPDVDLATLPLAVSPDGDAPAVGPVAVGAVRTRARRRVVAAAVIALIAGLVAWTQWGTIASTMATVRTADPVALICALWFAVISVVNRGTLYLSTHHAVGLRPPRRAMILVAAAAYAVNKIAKGAGPAGLALFIHDGARRGHSTGHVSAAYLAAGFCAHLGLGVVLVATLINRLAVDGGLANDGTRLWLLAAGGWVVVTAAQIGGLVLGSRNRALIQRLIARGHRIFERVMTRLGRSGGRRTSTCVNDFFISIRLLRRSPKVLARSLLHAVFDKMLGALVLACSLAAIGVPLDASLVLQAYGAALLASMIGVLPGGLGAVEASMAVVLTQRGLDAPSAAAAIALFRMVDLWVPLGIGSFAARHLARRAVTTSTGSAGAVTFSAGSAGAATVPR